MDPASRRYLAVMGKPPNARRLIEAAGRSFSRSCVILPSQSRAHPMRVVSADVGTTAQGSTIEARTALITVITVPGTANPSASLNALSRTTGNPDQLGFDITLSNTGNLLLTYSGSVIVYDADGHKVASLRLTPSDAYVVPAGHVPLAALWTGPIPRSGTYSARATVTVLADGAAVSTLHSQSLEISLSTASPLPLILAGGLACLLMLVLLTWWMHRRRRSRRRLGGLAKSPAWSTGT